MKKTIKLNDTYSVVIRKKETGNNYTQFAHVLENGDTIAGTSFINTETKENIIAWAKSKIIAESMDLFPHWDLLPNEVSEALQSFHDETYAQCDALINKLKPLGYTFEYYLDAIPFNLTKINNSRLQIN